MSGGEGEMGRPENGGVDRDGVEGFGGEVIVGEKRERGESMWGREVFA